MSRKHRLVTALCCLAVLAGLAGRAEAATIASSSIRGGVGDFFQCVAMNVSTKEREVTIEMRTIFGTPLGSVGPVTLVPGTGVAIAPASGAGTDGWCKITVKGSKSAVRGTLNLIDSDTITVLESIVQ